MVEEIIEDDYFIPSPILKGTLDPSSLGLDPISAFQKIGIKYNDLLEEHWAKIYEVEVLRTVLLNRCLQECQVKHEALEKKHYECKNLISEAELLRTEIDVLGNKCFQECRPKYNALKDILAQETSERKRLYNEVIEFRGNIRVFCRCRPLSTDEVSKDYNSTIDFDPYKDTELQITCTDSSRKIFKFDCVFNPKDDQDVVFAETLPVVKSVMDGFNVCIFAYGQTGTGKTFTMEGSPECRGVNYRALKELFRIMKERILLMRYEFSFSMLEVYNEKIKDLLAENSDSYTKKLDIKQSAEGTQEIPGLTEVQVCSVDEVWKLHKLGGKNRSVGSTTANELSSRSHSLVRVMVMGENLVTGERSRSFLWLVDLAGSERVGKIEVEGERLKESQFINKSLSALGDVISALASKNSHIPYRNSKLTHLLQSSLGGDCKTLMFAQISPSPADLGETLCTLNFASRVRGIEHGPARKQSDSADSFKIKQMAEKLRLEEKQVNKLNESLQMMHIKYASRENVIRTLQEKVRESEHACKDYQQKITDLQNNLAAERKGKKAVLGSAVNAKSASSLRPPLASGAVSRQRLPLARITNLLPPLVPPMPCYHHRASAAKENRTSIGWSKSSSFAGKARRISLSPIVCSSSISKNTTGTAAAAKEDDASKLPQLSMMMMRKRRATLATAATFQGTPIGGEQGKSRLQQLHQQTLWKANLPSSSPLQQQPGKLCYSIHKRVLLGASPARPANLLEAKEIPGRFGVAGRILIKNRRRSVAI